MLAVFGKLGAAGPWEHVDLMDADGRVESGDIVYNHTPTNGYFRGGVE